MSELVPGGNLPLPGGILTLRVPGPFDVSALVTDDGGKVRGDADFVFYNQPAAPGVRLTADGLTVDPAALRPGATRVTVVVGPEDPGTPLGRLPPPSLRVTGPGGRAVASFTPPRPRSETVLLLAEVYRRGPGWKLRALGQGYAEGLAGVARDFGVDVTEDGTDTAGAAGAVGASSAPPAGPAPAPGRLPGSGRGGGAGGGQGGGQGSGPRIPGLGSFRPGGLRIPGLGTSRPAPRPSAPPRPSGLPRPPAPPGPPVTPPSAAGRPGHRPSPATARPAPVPDPEGFLPAVNAARTRAGAPAVRLDARLTRAAREHAEVMAGAGRLMSEGPDGISVHQRVTAAGYAYLTVGEHLVSGPRSVAGFVDYCLSAERTRATLCDAACTDAGFAHVEDRRSGDVFWTAVWAAPFTPAGLARTAAEVLALTNAERRRAGLAPLSDDPFLTRAAQAHSDDMVARAFYSHTAPDGSRPWDRAAAAGSGHRAVGENIACGQRSAAEVVEGWMNSPGHRANILKPDFTHLGVGFAGGGPAGTYWTQLFGG